MLDIIANYHRMQFQEKLMVQTQENGKKPHFVSDLGPLDSKSDHHFSSFFFFFFRNLAFSVTRYHGQLSSCTISEKIMIQSSETLVTGGQMNRRTDRKTAESDFKGHCPTNVEHPTRNQYHFCIHFFFHTCMIK